MSGSKSRRGVMPPVDSRPPSRRGAGPRVPVVMELKAPVLATPPNREARRYAKRRGVEVDPRPSLAAPPAEPRPALPPCEPPRRDAACAHCGGGGYSTHDPSGGGLLLLTLEFAVPLAINDLARLPWSIVEQVATSAGQQVAEHADDLQFGGKHCASAFAALARGLAAISFAPGGVHFCGVHWCARHPESTATDGQYAARGVA